MVASKEIDIDHYACVDLKQDYAYALLMSCRKLLLRAVLAVDSVQELIKFRWSNPLRRLCDQCMEKDSTKFLNAVSVYDTYFEYLLVIWTRFVQEFTQYDACRR